MKTILILLFKLNLKFIYFLLKLLPVKKDKIVLLSRQSNSVSIDFFMIKQELLKRYSGYEIVILNKKIDKSFKSIISYYFHIYKQMYHIATTNICIIDTYIIPISILKHKKSLQIYQIWHAMGTVKKFGYQTLDKPCGKDKKISLLMNMHKNYTNIICGSEAIRKSLAEAFNYEVEKVIPNDLPRIDYLLKEKENIRKKIYKVYPKLRKKKNILYVPTFRTYKNDRVNDLINSIDLSKYNLIIKSHPVEKFDVPNIENLKYDSFSALQMLSVADFVITDYSTISVESTVLNIPLYFYIFDYDRYKVENGLNIDIKKEMPNVCFEDAKNLVNFINNVGYDYKVLKKFKNKYLYKGDGNGTKRLVDFIINNKK